MKNNNKLLLIVLFVLLALPYWVSAQTAGIYIDNTDQTIRGFGGMNFPRWIDDLSQDQAEKAFGNGYGQIGLSILRISVAPNSSSWALEVPTAQRARSLGAIVFATPWSPPASMKSNGSTTGGTLNPSSYQAYANHLRDFTNYMSTNGVPLYAISVQNEPDFVPNYESCGWSASQIRTFLDNNASVIPTRVMAPETVHFNANYMNTISGSQQVDILANHAYGGTATRANSTKEQWMTEHYAPNSNSNSANNWPEALEAGKEIHDYMINGYNAYIWWYIRRSYGLITENGSVSKRGFVMSHFAKFVRPGFVRVRAQADPTPGVSISAYKDGNTLVLVAINQNSSSRNITFNFSGYNVSNITKWETTGTVGNNIAEVGNYAGGSTLTNSLTGYSITTFRGTINGSGGGGGGISGYYQLQNRNTGLFLDGLGRTTDGAACGQYANTSSVNAQWEVIDVGNGYYQIQNRGTGLFLDGLGRTTNGDDVGQYANTSNENSHWSIEQYEGIYYQVQNRVTGLFLDGLGNTSNASACGQWANTTHPNSQWQLVSVAAASRISNVESASSLANKDIVIYPNPASTVLNIDINEFEEPVKARIFNSSGQVVLVTELQGNKNEIAIQGINKGIYFLELDTPSGVNRSKLIIE
ncbi:xylan degradation protein [Marivirga lumbricoides]|uniref:Xylan degradation protein n=1 Tax=Marivirga lumbricoides TaxID=1046115 RepID=A0ABQ1LAG4_9BACT|nr:xylan degradation protein [Marivirga lumbricoides]